MVAVVAGEVDQRSIVDDVARRRSHPGHRSLHPIVENLARHTTKRREGSQVATEHRLQILVQDKAGPEQAAVAEHQREQPDDACDARLVGKRYLELGEVDLRLVAWRRLEAHFEDGGCRRRQLAECIGDGGVAALIAALFELPKEAPTGQTGPGPDSLTQVRQERVDAPRTRLARISHSK